MILIHAPPGSARHPDEGVWVYTSKNADKSVRATK
jgi:hypothetical protein